MAKMVLKLPVGGVEFSMKARETIDCGCVALRLACVGATAAAVPRSADTAVEVAAPALPPTVPRSTMSAANTEAEPAMDKVAMDNSVIHFFCGKGQKVFFMMVSWR